MGKNTKKLLTLSKTFKKDADLLLKDSKVIELLDEFGEISFTGSYKLDLMLNPDIDFYVINPEMKKKMVVQAQNKLINHGFFNSYHFFDWVKWRKKYFPKGYYVGLQTEFNKRKWKIDIWFIKKVDKKEIKLMKLINENLNSDNKIEILKLKDMRNKMRKKMSSVFIYESVLKDGITDFEIIASQDTED